MNKKSASICDLLIANHFDILALTETWLSSRSNGNNTITEIINTLADFVFLHIPRSAGTGGGVGILLRKGFEIKQNETSEFQSFEYIDLSVTSYKRTIRLVPIYRPTPSKKNKLSSSMFFNEFSTLLEDLAITPEYLLITGDFNFHMDITTERDTMKFNDLLESAGLQQHISGPTHRRGHTLDLVIDWKEEKLFSYVETCNYLPSDHFGVVCSLDIPQPMFTKKHIKFRDLKHINTQLGDKIYSHLCPGVHQHTLTRLLTISTVPSTSSWTKMPQLHHAK